MKNIILNYIKKMNKNDLIYYINNKGYKVTDNEIDIIYNHIKKYPKELLNEPIKYIKMLKGKINDNNYREILNLFNEYKNYLN